MAAAALECVHCYSLAHDDLPAMDDDDLRRGRPTTHKAFDEATAILAGDGLLTFAFDILSRPQTHPDAEVRLQLVSALARASGLGGMVGGQMLDLAAEGRFDRSPPALGEQDVKTLAGDEDRRAVALRLRRRARFWARPVRPIGARSSATARRSAKRSRSPTTCSISKAIRRRSARRPARTRPRTRPPWSACSGPAPAKRRLEALVAEAQAALGPFGGDAECSRRQPASSRRAVLERFLSLGRRRPDEIVVERLVQLGGFEPPTSGSTDRRSNHLSYSCTSARERAAN